MDQYEYRISRISSQTAFASEWEKSGWAQVPALQISNAMGETPRHFPHAQVKMVYDEHSLLLFFRIEDRFVRSVARKHQDAVYKDSCVEFFFTPGLDILRGYFNLEVNCSGVMLFHFQKVPRKDSVAIADADLQKIEILHSLPERVEIEIEQPIVWTIRCKLPIAILETYFSDVHWPATGVQWKANFQKCADDSSHPHWLTWAKIDHPVPDFHRPQDFGTLTFE